MSSTLQERKAVWALYAGLVLTIAVTALPFVDSTVLADHIRTGYPSYDDDRVDAAVSAAQMLLGTVGILGIACWVVTLWAARRAKRWAAPLAVTALVIGVCVAVAALVVEDTSGEVGLPPLYGLAWLLPCVAGLAAVVALWRRAPVAARWRSDDDPAMTR